MACVEKKACVWWIKKYFRDCVCSLRSGISFGLGLSSLFFWGIAEIPQIITNFHAKSGSGVSLGFLFTWVIGDIFNLVGCLLEPATLPTQLYTAVLYAVVTVVLVLQTLYYDYYLRWWKCRSVETKPEVEDVRKPLDPKMHAESKPIAATASPKTSARVDVYYIVTHSQRSARSLASSWSPPQGLSYLGRTTARSGPSGSALDQDFSSEDENLPTPHRHRASTQPNQIVARSVGYGTFIIGSAGLPSRTKALMEENIKLLGRRILQEAGAEAVEISPLGLILGWIMAAIYIWGRLPQIYLNIKRGSVEGLNPLMFIFALMANATYVGSILVRSVEWEKIKANAPWLLDAILCVLLDLFIIIQYAYYKFMHGRPRSNGDESEGYSKPKDPLI